MGMANLKHFTPESLTLFKNIGDPQTSPCGEYVAYTLTDYDMEGDKQVTNIYKVKLEDKSTSKLTEDGSSNTPRWSPDGSKLAYFTTVEKQKKLCIMDKDGSEKSEIIDIESSNSFIHRSGEKLSWSPDGKQLLYSATPDPKPDHENIIVTDRQIMYNLTSHVDDRRTQVYTVEVDGGEPKQHTSGEYDNHSPVWTPDGKIVFISDRTPLHDQHVNYQVYLLDPATGEENKLTNTEGAFYRPSVSPDGEWVAVQHVKRPLTSNDSVSEDSHLWAIELKTGYENPLSGYLDRPVYSHTWTPDSKPLYVANNQGMFSLYLGDFDGSYILLNREESMIPWGCTPSMTKATIAYTKSTPDSPGELYVIKKGDESKVTEYNKFVEEYEVAPTEGFWFQTWDGPNCKGWVMKPAGYKEGEKYPTILLIHGGPHGSFGEGFDTRAQLIASAGYAVIKVDPRGSSGYGQFWSDGCLLNWGGGDYKDIMAGVDHCIEKYRFIDSDKMGVTGGSYGGYMTNWVITHTDMFKAAVSRACVSNLLSFYGTSAVGSLIEQEFNGNPWENLSLLRQWSPITHAHKAKTPLLLLHGTADMTCPMGQSEEMFRALKRHGVPTRIVRYKGEGHGIRKKPSNLIHYYQAHLDWFKKYI